MALARFGYKNFREQIGAVLQDDNLFAGTLADNIALSTDAPDTKRITDAAIAAALHDEIAAMPMGYETLIGDMGSNLSGGQRQRLLLARTLYKCPKILIMDEGTSALDTIREQIVNDAVARMGVTRIVVAHRLETILAAQKIYAMAEGSLKDITLQMQPVKQGIELNRSSGVKSSVIGSDEIDANVKNDCH